MRVRDSEIGETRWRAFESRRSAECHSAIQQDAILRYGFVLLQILQN